MSSAPCFLSVIKTSDMSSPTFVYRLGNAEPDRETWKKAYELFIRAFKEPASESDKKRLAKILKKPARKEVADEIFEYDAFLRGLGRMSLSKLPSEQRLS